MNEALVLETHRCYLRAPQLSDTDYLVALIDPRIVAFTTLPWPYEKKHAQAWIKKSKKVVKKNQGVHYVITNKAHVVMGTVTLDCTREGVELGYWLASSFAGHGIMTEAIKAVLMLSNSTLNWPLIYAKVMIENLASIRVLEKCGFKRVSVIMNAVSEQGVARHLYLYQINLKEVSYD